MRFKDERGSAIVEVAMIFPMMVILIFVMMVYGVYMYEQVAAQVVMDDVISRAAANWATADEGIYVEEPSDKSFMVWDIYSRVLDFSDSRKYKNIKDETFRLLNKACPVSHKFRYEDIHLDPTNFIIYKSLDMRVEREFQMPYAGFLRSLGIQDKLNYTLYSTAVIQDAPELIRTMDLAGDLMEGTAIGRGFEKFQGALDKVVQFFSDFKLGGN